MALLGNTWFRLGTMACLLAYLYYAHSQAMVDAVGFFVTSEWVWLVGALALLAFVPFFYVASAETGFSSFGVCRSHSSIVADDLRCMFANLFLPAGTGLDLLRLVLLKEGGVKLDKVGALTLLDRGVTLASLLTLASVSLVVLMSVSKISFDVGVLLMLFLAVPVCVVCAAAFFFRSRGGVFASERGRCGAIAWLNRFAGYLGLVMKRGGDLGAAFGGCRVESALHFCQFWHA